jgi:hypothetical protein
MPSVAESKSIVEGNTIFTQNQQSSTSKDTFVQHSSISLDAPQVKFCFENEKQLRFFFNLVHSTRFSIDF